MKQFIYFKNIVDSAVTSQYTISLWTKNSSLSSDKNMKEIN